MTKPICELIGKWRKEADNCDLHSAYRSAVAKCADQLEAAIREQREGYQVLAIDRHRVLCMDPPYTSCRISGSCTGQLVADAFEEVISDLTEEEG